MKNTLNQYITLSVVCLTLFASCKWLLPTQILPYSMVQYQKQKFIDETEVTVEQWGEFVFNGHGEHKPDSVISSRFAYHQLFYPTNEPDSMYQAFGKIDYYQLPVQKTYFDTLNYAELRNILDYPISGISYENAKAYCNWRTEKYNELRTPHTDQQIVFTLPDSVFLKPLVSVHGQNKHERKEPIANFQSAEYEQQRDAKNKLIFNQIGIQPVKATALQPNDYGVYGLQGNVAEMTNEKGLAYGGSYLTDNETIQGITYTRSETWLGFRCVGIVQE